MKQNLTASVYSFEKLRREGYLYVDKTEYIWQLINPAGESYFLNFSIILRGLTDVKDDAGLIKQAGF